MSRGDARRAFSAGDLAARMAGKVWNADRADALVDEIPDSYKDIDEVMAAQTDLVAVEHTLRQVFNYKGT
jgi:tRNA-splicing ligase RtcB